MAASVQLSSNVFDISDHFRSDLSHFSQEKLDIVIGFCSAAWFYENLRYGKYLKN